MILTTNRLMIRPFIVEDLEDMHAYCALKGVGECAGWPAHTSLQESSKILDSWIAGNCKHAIVLLESKKVIGHIAIDPDSEENRADTRELGCALHTAFQRQGLMSEAIKAVIEQLFNEESVSTIWACCFQNNKASKSLIEKCGFQFIQEGTYYSGSLGKEFLSYEYCLSRHV